MYDADVRFWIALPANTALLEIWTKAGGTEFATKWAAGLTAPINEEFAKALGLVLLIGLAPRLVRSAYDGFIIGAFIGLGFQVFEDVLYVYNGAAQSFGVFRESPHDVAWRFKPDVAGIAREYLFHPSQRMEEAADGSLIVRFSAGGLLEMCWHLYTWGDGVEVLAPSALKERMKQAHRHRNFRLAEP